MRQSTLRSCLVTATALSGTLIASPALADCVSQAPVNPEQVVCDAPGTLGWDGSATNDIVVTVNNTGSVLTSAGGPALISTGTNSAVINFSGNFDGNVTPTVYGIDAGTSSDPAISVGGGSIVTNSSGAAIEGTISFGSATGTTTSVLDNNYSSTGGTNHIGLIDGNVSAVGNFTFNNAGIMGWTADVGVTQTGAGSVTINNGIDGGYVTGIVGGVFPYRNAFIWNASGTAISTEGSTTLVNHGGGNGMGALINGDVVLGTLGNGTSTITNGSTTYGNATIIGNITMADLNNTITNDGTITGDVTMNGTGTNTYNAGSLGSSGNNGYRMPGVPIDVNGLPTGIGTGTLTGLSGADNVLNLNGVGSSTLGANVVNFYTINKNDTGNWTITTQLVADAAQTINNNAGVLYVNDADFLNTAGGTTIHNSTAGVGIGGLIFSGVGAGTFSGNIDGVGTVGVTGPNATTFTGTNTQTGLTYVYTGGVLNANSTGALSAASDMYLYNGTLNVNASNSVNNLFDYFGPNTSVVNIASGVSLSVAGGYFGNNGGVINGPGDLIKYSTGTLDLSGANQINPGSLIVNDGTVNDNGGALGSSVAVAVNSTATTAGVLNVNASDTIGSLAGTGANAQVNLATGATLTTGGLNTSTTYAGHIAGDGALVKEGTGAMTLTGGNSYAGGTTINGGSIIGFAGTTATNGSLQGDIAIALGASLGFDQTLSPIGNTSGTYAGQLSGAGFVTFLGNNAGILTLTGNNSGLSGQMNFFSGSIVSIGDATNVGTGNLNFADGTLMTTADMTLANTVSLGSGASGTFNTASGTTLTLSNSISGAGSLVKTGTGTLLLTGPNSYTGGTTVSAGTLQGEAGSSVQGDIVNNAAVVLTGSFDIYGGDMSGTGTVEILGTVGLAGTNTYSGTTTVAAGNLLGALSPNGLSANSTHIIDGALGDTVGGFAGDQTIGALSGSGTVQTDGWTLTTGGNNASTTFSGQFLAGSGSLVKTGTGTFTLSGTGSQLSGNLGVNAGTLSLTGTLDSATTTVASGATLRVDGTLTSPTVTIASGGWLRGGIGTAAGTIVGDVTNNGTISPGTSPGIIAISGSYTQGSTGTYAVEVLSNGTSTVVAGVDYDRIAVSGTPGTATLAGTLAVTRNSNLYVAGTVFDIITTTGGITGNFSSITGNVISPFITLSNAAASGGGVVGNNYRLIVVRSAYNTVATNPNQVAVANGLQGLVASPTAAATVVKIDNMTAAQAQDLFDTASPEPYGAYATALQDQGELFTRQVQGRMSDTVDTGKTGLWLTGYGQWADGKNHDFRFGSDHRTYGIAGGVDFGMENVRVGLAAGYSEDKVEYLQGNSDGKSKSWQVGGYAAYTAGKLVLDAQVAYINGDISATKSVAAGAGSTLITGVASANTDGHLFKGIATVGYDLGSGDLKLKPYVGVDFTSGKVNGFTESGMGVLDLTVEQIDADRTDIVGGFELSAPMSGITPFVNAAYRYRVDSDSRDVTAYFNGLSGSAFSVSAINSSRSRIDVDAGISAKIGETASVFVSYQGTFRNDLDSHGASGGFRLSF